MGKHVLTRGGTRFEHNCQRGPDTQEEGLRPDYRGNAQRVLELGASETALSLISALTSRSLFRPGAAGGSPSSTAGFLDGPPLQVFKRSLVIN